MPVDAVGALGDMSDRDRNELLGLAVERAVREDRAAELLEGPVRRGASSLRCAASALVAG
jgi:hypothetical protein